MEMLWEKLVSGNFMLLFFIKYFTGILLVSCFLLNFRGGRKTLKLQAVPAIMEL